MAGSVERLSWTRRRRRRGSGAGGAIRLVATAIAGNGTLSTRSGHNADPNLTHQFGIIPARGATGRIELRRLTFTRTATSTHRRYARHSRSAIHPEFTINSHRNRCWHRSARESNRQRRRHAADDNHEPRHSRLHEHQRSARQHDSVDSHSGQWDPSTPLARRSPERSLREPPPFQ